VGDFWYGVISSYGGMIVGWSAMFLIGRFLLKRKRKKLRDLVHGSKLMERIMLNAAKYNKNASQLLRSVVTLGPFEIHVKHQHDKNVVPSSTLYAACVLKGLEGLVDIGIDGNIIDCVVQNALELAIEKGSSPKGDKS
jgi:hypothetical protein